MYIADLHIHSSYSRATSRDCNLENLDLWARRKGIHIVGTGDFTHPAWREEMKEKLEPAEEGLYRLKEQYRIRDNSVADTMLPRFVITGEISSIYKKNGRVRKVHSLLLLPGLNEAGLLAGKLEVIGNIHSDGRPILGLDCRDLLEIMLEMCPDAIYVPAHIWTPHFSLFGAFSGFDSVEECFGDLSGHIRAMETGLSSDPPMNWRVSALDPYQLISNSDAHSPAKLGREANLLDIELSYAGLRDAIQEGKGLYGTIEFFPEEGKYHYDGHRKCNVCLTPLETERFGGMCPVCKRKLTIGVSHRVEQLADRGAEYIRENAKPFESLVPLPEVIGASLGHSPASVKVQKEYQNMLCRLGDEFKILRTVPPEDIQKVSGHLIAEGIRRLREGRVERIPGFDGEYGIIKLFSPGEIDSTEGQLSFFEALQINIDDGNKGVEKGRGNLSGGRKIGDMDLAEETVGVSHSQAIQGAVAGINTEAVSAVLQNKAEILNQEQEKAVRIVSRYTAVIAGPGTGKTKTLLSHLFYLLENRKVMPSEITAVTFTNQAAGEMRERIRKYFGKKRGIEKIRIGTFHGLCLEYLKDRGIDFSLADDVAAMEAARRAIERVGIDCTPKQLMKKISLFKSGQSISSEEEAQNDEWRTGSAEYQKVLGEQGMLDFDDLLLKTLELVSQNQAGEEGGKSFSYLLVDEFQDINPIQYRLIMEWNKKGKELFVIGDPDQSVYGFRGSDAECFDKLRKDCPNIEEVRLEENYRSVPAVLQAASKLISCNPGPKRVLKAHCHGDMPVRVLEAGSEMGEAIFIAKEINRMAGGIGMLEAQSAGMGNGCSRGFGDIAVLYRTHRQAELLEKCLRTEGIPYIIAGREAFLEEDSVRGSISFFKCLANEGDEFSRMLSLKLLWGLDRNEVSDAVFEEAAGRFRKKYQKSSPRRFLDDWIQEMELKENTAIMKLAEMTVFYKSMPEFMQALAMGIESDLKRCGDKKYTGEAVTLMTLHGAKGLEFPVTFIYGVRKGMVPFERGPQMDIEEERRLFYVGMTRAREELILTSSGLESIFMEEISSEGIQKEKADKRKNTGTGKQMNLFDFI